MTDKKMPNDQVPYEPEEQPEGKQKVNLTDPPVESCAPPDIIIEN